MKKNYVFFKQFIIMNKNLKINIFMHQNYENLMTEMELYRMFK